jgi:hypothetical protein
MCTDSTCVNGNCVLTPHDCNDNVDCTQDTCDLTIGCVHALDHSSCETLDSCKTPICTPTGCSDTPKNCDDLNPCTTDTCSAGRCVHTPHNFCNDNLRCTTDKCVVDDSSRFHCTWDFIPSNCAPFSVCQRPQCGFGIDCLIISDDSSCPPSNVTCKAPICTNAGCDLKDTCVPTSVGCDGCAQCSCQVSLNKCVKSCPSKRSLEESEVTDGGYMNTYCFLFLILCLIFNRM